MYWLFIVLYAVHVIAAIVWFGGGLTSVLITGPALQKASEGARSEVGFEIGMLAQNVYPVAATLTIVVGATLAVLAGRVTSIDALLSPYGITAVIALTLAVGVWLWGQRVIGPTMKRMAMAAPADRAPLLVKGLRAIAVEQLGFFAVFGCMVLMRFGI